MSVHVLVLNVEKHFQTIAVNVVKVLNCALNMMKSFRPFMTWQRVYVLNVGKHFQTNKVKIIYLMDTQYQWVQEHHDVVAVRSLSKLS